MTRVRVFVVAILLALGALSLGACTEKDREPWRDAPTGERNSKPADIIEMPDGFSNAATKCDHGNRVYIAYKGDKNRAAIAVVANDSTCAGRG